MNRMMKKIKIITLYLLIVTISAFAQNCAYKGGKIDYLPEILCKKDFEVLKGVPLSQKYGNVSAIKIVYEISKKKIYYIHSIKYKFHYNFCFDYLNTYNNLAVFNAAEYSDGNNRRFVLANLNHYEGPDIYTLEFFADDKVPPARIRELFEKVKLTTSFGDKIKLLNNSPLMEQKLNTLKLSGPIPVLSVDSLYKNQEYQPLNLTFSYGYLKKVEAKNFSKTLFSPNDIIITNGLPNEFPICQGIITSCFQTPLCHINILSANRGTPNAAWKNVFDNPRIDQYLGKLVYYSVTRDSLIIRTADSLLAVKFWEKQKSKQKVIQFKPDYSIKKLLLLEETGYLDINKVGGKAANFAELNKIKINKKNPLPIPEGGFIIPFYFYQQHVIQNGLQPLIDEIVKDKYLINNRDSLEKKLKRLQKAIKNAPLDKNLIKMTESKIRNSSYPYEAYRFRSSTNAEDIPGFNGAGLYTSKTGIPGDKDKPVEKAIKQVYASLWNLRAFEEREYYKIDHSTVAMGVLVHRAFGEEAVNGVVITKNLYRKDYPSFTVNAQDGEVSVVLPENDSITCDQFLIHFSYGINGRDEKIIEYISKSNITKGRTVMTQDEIIQLADYVTAVKKHFYNKTSFGINAPGYDDFALDIEFKLDKKTRKIYIKQARLYGK